VEKGTLKLLAAVAFLFASSAALSPRAVAQSQPAPAQNPPAQQTQPASPQNKPSTPSSGSNNNPFPEDESTVPVMPNRDTINTPAANGAANEALPLPGDDVDPVASPESRPAVSQGESSSSLAGIDAIDPGPDTDTQPTRKHGKHQDVTEPEHKETAAEDEDVGKYYLDNKDWRAALSRFESALVLDPDNPDVYWGLAESQRHLGRFADARENYQKVMEYDPGSRHAKDAGKALKEPEIANAKATPTAQNTPSVITPPQPQ
jgi:tetratricopeptide (TPR) repeat protein